MSQKYDENQTAATSMKVTQQFQMTKEQIFKLQDNFQAYSSCIKYLNSFNGSMAQFLKQSQDIMKYLQSRFSTTKFIHLPWIKFLDVANKMAFQYMNNIDQYKNKISRIIRYVLLNNGNRDINGINWKIQRKLCSVNTVIEETLINSIIQDKFIQGFQEDIDKSLNYLIWVQDTFLIQYTRNLLMQLKSYCKDTANHKNIIDSLRNGRFDKQGQSKNKLAFLDHSLVFGEDGGLFLLLNSLDSKFKTSLQQLVGKQYIKQKSQKGKNGSSKVILGKGSFGKVRFALNLFYMSKYPGDIVCVKKTNNIKQLQKNSSMSPDAAITTNTLDDYFASQMSDLIFSPKVLDMAIVIQSPAQVETIHQKGYLFMEIIPQNTATKVFSKSKYQTWEYQKPYLLDMFDKVNKLLKNDIAFTDLKPDNTLFNVFNRKTSLIDLGGTVKDKDLQKYKGSYQFTPQFSAPQIKNKEKEINLVSTVSYACGLIVKYLSKNTDFNKKILDQFAAKLMDKRISLQQASFELQRIGDDRWKQAVIFANYINRIQSRLQSNKSSININEDIEETIKTFIPLSLVHNDPYKYRNLQTLQLFQQIDQFLQQKSSGVFLLLAKAGSGKSVVLQQQFIKNIRSWKQGKPLPIFINLANNTSLQKILQSLDDELNTNLKANIKGKQILLFIDSFDQGVNITKYRQTLINQYFSQLSNESKDNVKMIISCRSDFLQSDNDENWFKPATGSFFKYYIAPLDYVQNHKWNDYIKSWCKLKQKEDRTTLCIQYFGKFKEIIVTGFIFQLFMSVFVTIPQHLTNFVTKIQLYKLYIKYYILKKLEKLNKQQRLFIKQSFIKSNPHTILEDRIFEVGCYLASKMHINEEFRIKNNDPIFNQFQYRTSQPIKIQKIWCILKLLPLKIQKKEKFTTKYDYKQDVAVGFIHDTLKNYFLLQEIKKELKNNGESKILSARNISENIELVGFIRDSIQNQKNPSLVAQLKQLIQVSKTNKSVQCITAAANAITILVAAQICLSGYNFTNISIKGANVKNGVFQYSNFTNADLSGVNFTNADIVGCKFNGANMASIQLSTFPMLLLSTSALITIAYSPDSQSIAMSLQNGTIEIYQFSTKKVKMVLKGHEKRCFGLIYSKDGSRIVSGSQDGTVKIWDTKTGAVIIDIKFGHEVCGIGYSPDQKTLVVGGNNPQIKLYDATTGNELATYKNPQKYDNAIAICYSPDGKQIAFACQSVLIHAIVILDASNGKLKYKIEKDTHRMLINWICYSPDGKYLASCSADHSIKMWNSNKSYQAMKTINAHSDSVSRICFSPNSKFIASGSFDRTLKIIDVQTSTVIKEMNGHRYWITSVCYSPDSRFIVTGGGDLQVRMWDTNISYTSLQNLPLKKKKIIKIGYRTASPYIAIHFDDEKSLSLYSLVDYQFVRYIQNNSDYTQIVTISPDFKNVIYTKYGQVWTYNIETEKAVKKQCGDQLFMCFSEDCKLGVSKYWAGNTKIDFRIWDIEKGKMMRELTRQNEHLPQCKVAAISFDNRLIAIDQGNNQPKTEQHVRLFNVSQGTLINTLAFQAQVLVLLFNQKCQLICGGSNPDKSLIKLWNAQSGQVIHSLQNFNRDITSISTMKNSNKLVVGYSNSGFNIVSIDSNTAIDLFGHNASIVNAFVFSQNDKQIISASSDCTLRLWNLTTLEQGEQKWCYSKTIIGAQTPLQAVFSKLQNVRNLSENNIKILQQKYGEVTNGTGSQIYNDKSMQEGLVKYRLKICGDIQKRLPIKQVVFNFRPQDKGDEEESQMVRKNIRETFQMDVRQSKKTPLKPQQRKQQYSSSAYESQSERGCCCQVYKVNLVYDNPLLNTKNGLTKAAKLLNISVIELYKRTSEDIQFARLIELMID